MSLRDYLPSFLRPTASLATPIVITADGKAGPPDMGDFERASWELGSLTTLQIAQLASVCAVDANSDPRTIPLEVLELLDYDPVFYAGDAAVCGPALDPELYYLRGSTKDVAETDAWLQPILPDLVSCFARAFSYGSIPIVLDWTAEDLTFEVPGEDGKPARNRTLPAHAHYGRVHELWPSDVTWLDPKTDRLESLIYGGRSFGGQDLDDPSLIRGFLATWDKQFGRRSGKGSRRRAFAAWWHKGRGELWNARYLERNVDLARIGKAPEGKVKVNGQEIEATKILRAAVLSLRNGSALILPSTFDANGNALWSVDVLEGPDGAAETFDKALTRYDLQMLWASLAPQGAVDKTTEEQFSDHTQKLCDFVAQRVTEVVQVVDRVRNGKRAGAPRALANDVPKRKRKLLFEVFSRVCDARQRLADGREFSLAELIHAEILPQLGVRARPVEEAARKPDPVADPSTRQPGRPIDVTSGRDQRREDAKTIDGEGDTGGKDVQREERA